MRLRALHLIAFGPFTDLTLDFSRPGLHLVYGPNEAGKSSALRAIRQALYGIDERTDDAFRHPNAQLRIGAELEQSDGTRLEFCRRKGRKNTLRTSDDKQPIPEQSLDPFLSGVSRDVFSVMFGINHADLVSGGELMLSGEGELGQILFAAGSGVSGLRTLQQQLQQELDALYKPRGRNQRLNGLLLEFDKQRKRVREDALPDAEWSRHDQALRDFRRELARLDDQLKQVEGQQNRLDRIRAALPAIGRWKQTQKELADVQHAILLPEGFAARRADVEKRLPVARRDREAAMQRLGTLKAQLAEIPIPGAVLDAAEAIQNLHSRLQVYRKAMHDRPQLIVQRDQFRAQAASLLRELRPGVSPEQAREVALSATDAKRIQELGTKAEALAARLQDAQKTLETTRRRMERLRSELPPSPQDAETGPLQRFLKRTLARGDLEAQRDEAASAVSEAERSLAVSIARLPGFSGTPEELERLPVPEVKTIERFQAELAAAERQCEELHRDLKKVEQSRQKIDQKILAVLKAGDVPTEQSLKQARLRRDQAWQIIRRIWREGLAESSEEVQEFLSDEASPTDLAAAFEVRIQRTDELADQLRYEAERVTALSQLQEELDACTSESTDLTRRLEQAESARQAVAENWKKLWQPLGIDPLPPAEMLGWLNRQADIVRQCADLGRLRLRHVELSSQIDAAQSELQSLVTELNEPWNPAGDSLAFQLDSAQLLLERLDETRRTQSERLRQLQEAERELPELEHEVKLRKTEREQWQTDWADAMHKLGLGAKALPAEAYEMLDRMQELSRLLDEADSLDKSRIAAIDADATLFAEDVATTMNRLAPELADKPVELAVEELERRLQQAKSADERRQNLEAQQECEQDSLHAAELACEQAEAEVRELCQQAQVNSPAELSLAEERAARRGKLEHESHQLTEEILHHAGGMSFEDFLADAASVDVDTLEFELSRLNEQAETLKTERDRVRDSIKTEEHELKRMNGGSAAAEASAELQNLQAEIVSAVEEYVPLRLALGVLQKGVERYRERHQGPVLERASKSFSTLTCGSFDSLRVEFDANGRQTLMGVRAGTNELVSLGGMSRGTADQLYLALRIASLEEYVSTHEPMPFIVDDVLVDFDDARAAAALHLLAELSQQTQVIVFTHHRHVVELAHEHLAKDAFCVHTLGTEEEGIVAASGNGKDETREPRRPSPKRARKKSTVSEMQQPPLF